jgi:hypothetical protein
LIPFNLDKKGTEQIVHFEVSPPKESSEVIAKVLQQLTIKHTAPTK